MAQKVKFKRKTTEEIDDLEIEDGSLIYNIENGKTYMDYGNQRIPTGGGSNGGIYVGEEEPTDPDVTLWVDTPISETKASEIVDEYTESDKVGYSTNYINNLKNIMTIHIDENTDVNNGSIIPFTTSNSIGSKLTFENNGIKIGVGVSKVMVNFNLSVRYTATTGKVYGADMLINGTVPGDASGKQLAVRAHKSIGEPINSSSGVRIIDVNENDVLTLKVNSGATCPCTPTTFLTVEVVE